MYTIFLNKFYWYMCIKSLKIKSFNRLTYLIFILIVFINSYEYWNFFNHFINGLYFFIHY